MLRMTIRGVVFLGCYQTRCVLASCGHTWRSTDSIRPCGTDTSCGTNTSTTHPFSSILCQTSGTGQADHSYDRPARCICSPRLDWKSCDALLQSMGGIKSTYMVISYVCTCIATEHTLAERAATYCYMQSMDGIQNTDVVISYAGACIATEHAQGYGKFVMRRPHIASQS